MNAYVDRFARPYSTESESFFLRLVEDIGIGLEPTKTQFETLERSYRSTGEFLVECPEFEGQLEEVYAQGSRALGTMTRPLRKNFGYDVDLVARLNSSALQIYTGRTGANDLINRLHSAVTRYARQHNLQLRRWERCVTLEYADGMCADIAPIIDFPHRAATHGDSHGLIPDRDLSTFHPTNPRGFSKLFNEIAAISPVFTNVIVAKGIYEEMRKAEVAPLPNTEVFGSILCRLIQVMKLHRDMAFSTEALSKIAPSSIFITAITAASYKIKAPIPHNDQLDLLLDILRSMPDFFDKSSRENGGVEWVIDNPTAPGDNLASSMNFPEKHQAFVQWHKKLVSDVLSIIESIDSRQGIDKVFSLVESSFGIKVGASVRTRALDRQAEDRKAGTVRNVTSAGIIIPVGSRSHTFFGA